MPVKFEKQYANYSNIPVANSASVFQTAGNVLGNITDTALLNRKKKNARKAQIEAQDDAFTGGFKAREEKSYADEVYNDTGSAVLTITATELIKNNLDVLALEFQKTQNYDAVDFKQQTDNLIASGLENITDPRIRNEVMFKSKSLQSKLATNIASQGSIDADKKAKLVIQSGIENNDNAFIQGYVNGVPEVELQDNMLENNILLGQMGYTDDLIAIHYKDLLDTAKIEKLAKTHNEYLLNSNTDATGYAREVMKQMYGGDLSNEFTTKQKEIIRDRFVQDVNKYNNLITSNQNTEVSIRNFEQTENLNEYKNLVLKSDVDMDTLLASAEEDVILGKLSHSGYKELRAEIDNPETNEKLFYDIFTNLDNYTMESIIDNEELSSIDKRKLVGAKDSSLNTKRKVMLNDGKTIIDNSPELKPLFNDGLYSKANRLFQTKLDKRYDQLKKSNIDDGGMSDIDIVNLISKEAIDEVTTEYKKENAIRQLEEYNIQYQKAKESEEAGFISSSWAWLFGSSLQKVDEFAEEQGYRSYLTDEEYYGIINQQQKNITLDDLELDDVF